MADPFSVKMAKVDAEDWLNDENENALIDMWQTKPVPYDVTGYGVIIIGFLKLKSVSKSICCWIKLSCACQLFKLNINWSNWFYDL